MACESGFEEFIKRTIRNNGIKLQRVINKYRYSRVKVESKFAIIKANICEEILKERDIRLKSTTKIDECLKLWAINQYNIEREK